VAARRDGTPERAPDGEAARPRGRAGGGGDTSWPRPGWPWRAG